MAPGFFRHFSGRKAPTPVYSSVLLTFDIYYYVLNQLMMLLRRVLIYSFVFPILVFCFFLLIKQKKKYSQNRESRNFGISDLI